jgi:integrase
MVKRRTKAAFGRSIGPHMARDGAVTFIATFHGEHILAASAHLGHVDPATTQRHYNQAQMITAVQAYQKALAAHCAGTDRGS